MYGSEKHIKSLQVQLCSLEKRHKKECEEARLAIKSVKETGDYNPTPSFNYAYATDDMYFKKANKTKAHIKSLKQLLNTIFKN
jgi:hypothetical protein